MNMVFCVNGNGFQKTKRQIGNTDKNVPIKLSIITKIKKGLD